METNNELKDRLSCLAQGTSDWLKARLGKITSSNVHFVMKCNKPTKNNPTPETFNDTAKGYLYRVAAERNLRTQVVNDDLQFEEYMMRVDVSSRDIRWGQENEDIARKVYEKVFQREVAQAGFILHDTIDNYGDSPDGIVLDDKGKPIGVLEIKCPKPETFIRYKATIHNAEQLKEEKPEYYWQCQSHCECNHLQWCDFVFFDKMQKNGFVCIRINQNDEDVLLMKNRILLANEFINSLL